MPTVYSFHHDLKISSSVRTVRTVRTPGKCRRLPTTPSEGESKSDGCVWPHPYQLYLLVCRGGTTWVVQCGAINTHHVTGIHNNCTTLHHLCRTVSGWYAEETGMTRVSQLHWITIYCITNCNWDTVRYACRTSSGWYVCDPYSGIIMILFECTVYSKWKYELYFCCIMFGCRVIQICENPVFNGLPMQHCFQQLFIIKSCLCYGALSFLQVVEKNNVQHSWSMSKSACVWHRTKLGAETNAELHNYHDDTEIMHRIVSQLV